MPRDLQRIDPTAQEIYYAARRVLDQLPPEEQEKLRPLLKRGQADPASTDEVLKRLKSHSQIREWLLAALYPPPEAATRSYVTLPGGPGPIPVHSLWRCPQCGFTWRVLRKGRPVPPCPRDGATLILVQSKE